MKWFVWFWKCGPLFVIYVHGCLWIRGRNLRINEDEVWKFSFIFVFRVCFWFQHLVVKKDVDNKLGLKCFS